MFTSALFAAIDLMGLQNVNHGEPMIELHEPGHDADSVATTTMTGRHQFHLTPAEDVGAQKMLNNLTKH